MGRNYSQKSEPVTTDLAFIWDSENSDWRLTTMTAIQALFAANEAVAADVSIKEPLTQYAAPATTGFSVEINDDNLDVHLILTPASTLAEGEIVLPAPGNARDKQTVMVNCTQQVTSFSVDGNGATGLYGIPSSLGADDFFTLKYDLAVDSWYRVG